MPSFSNSLKYRQTPTRIPYSCQAQLATSGIIVCPEGAGMAVRGIGREMSHTSRLTIVQIMTLPPLGGFKRGRSTIAEYGLRSGGVMALFSVFAYELALSAIRESLPNERDAKFESRSTIGSGAQTPQIFL